MKKYTGIVFDMDGTILDTIEDITECFNRVMAQYSHRHDYRPDEVTFFFGSGIVIAVYRALLIENGYTFSQVLQFQEVDIQYIDLVMEIANTWKIEYQKVCNLNTKPFQGMIKFLQLCKENHMKIAVVSNKPDASVQKLAIEYFGDIFDVVLGENEQRKKKPAPDLVYDVMNELDLTKEEIIFVGDTEVDIETAHNVGCDVVGVTWGYRDQTYLKAFHPTYLIDMIHELNDIVFLKKHD